MPTLTIIADPAQCDLINVFNNANQESQNFTQFPAYFIFNADDTLTLQATAKAGFAFTQWYDGAYVNPDNPLNINYVSDVTITASFVQTAIFYTLTVNAPVGSGTTNPPTGIYTNQVADTTRSVQAFPSVGYRFDHWVVDASYLVGNPLNVLMDSDHSVTAYFVVEDQPPTPPPPFGLIAVVAVVAVGTVGVLAWLRKRKRRD